MTPPDSSAVLNNLPTGAVCRVNERPPYGGADGPAEVIPDSVTIGDGQEALVTLTATNTFTLGELTLRKTVDGLQQKADEAKAALEAAVAQLKSTTRGD